MPKGLNSRRAKNIKARLYVEQDGNCALCGELMEPIMVGTESGQSQPRGLPTLDHIKRKREGGKNHTRNFQLVHRICNERRA